MRTGARSGFMQNYTIVDALGALKACIALTPVMLAPGYVIGWILNLFEFRQRRAILRFVLSVPLTIAICPMFSYLLARFATPALWVFYISTSVGGLLLLAIEVWRFNLQRISKSTWVALGCVVLWVILSIGSLVDLQIRDNLYPSITAYDHSTRIAIMAAIARHVPPNNPFFAHPSVPLRYHYLWMLLCSLPLKVSHLRPRYLMYAGIVWCGLGFISSVALGLKFLLRTKTSIEQQALLAIVLLSVTGLDILPTAYIGFTQRFWLSDMEWWNDPQISSWAASLLWVPHHVAALIACFIGFLLLRHEADADRRWTAVPVIAAGLSFASAVGLSVYVTFTFVLAIILWLLALAARKKWREAAIFVAAGAVAFAWTLPYLLSLRGPGSGAAFAEFALRPFPLGLYVLQEIGISFRNQSAVNIANAIFLPINYALEFGFFLLVGILRLRQLLLRRIEASDNELAGWTLVLSGFLIGTFMRSSTITTNDLGIRCFLPAQLILLLWGAAMLYEWRRDRPQAKPSLWAYAAVTTVLILGIFGTTYELFMLRMFPLLHDRGVTGQSWQESDRQFGKRTYALRSLYEDLDTQLNSAAVVQNNPATEDPIPHMLYSGHDTAAGGLDCGIAFGGDRGLCDQRVRRLVALFEYNHGSLDGACRDYGIDVVVAQDTDRAWHQGSSWIWTQNAMLSNDYVRAFRCAATTDSVQLSGRGVSQ